jgi:aspartyl protease family protein
MQHAPDQGDTPRRIGRGMIAAAWVLGLILLTLFFNDQLDRQRNPNRNVETIMQDGGAREVILKRNRIGHYVASGTINGQPVEFMVDTGASDVSIPEGIARRLSLQAGTPLRYQTANGPVTAYQTTLDRVELGGISIGPVAASINPAAHNSEVLLGMSFLKHLDFSQEGNTLTLRSRP